MLAVPFRKIDYSCNQILNLSFCIGSPSFKAHLNLTSVWQLISLGICQIIRHLIFQCWLPLESLLKVVNSPKKCQFHFFVWLEKVFFSLKLLCTEMIQTKQENFSFPEKEKDCNSTHSKKSFQKHKYPKLILKIFHLSSIWGST